jgi:HEAT repeat protein
MIPGFLKLKDRRENPFARQAMAKMLVKDKIAGIGPVLEVIIKDTKEDLKMRITAAKYIGELVYKTAAPALMDIIKNREEETELRQTCIETLGAFNDKQVLMEVGAYVIEFDIYTNSLAMSYIQAVEKSKYIKDKDVLIVLWHFLGVPKPDVKIKVVDALSGINDKQIYTILMIALFDKSPMVRKEAIKPISKMGGSNAVALFISMLEEEKKDEIREMYVDELLKLSIPKLKPIWIEELTKRIGEEKKSSTKAKLTEALDRIKKAQSGLSPGETTGQKTFTAPVKAPGKK